MVRSRVRTRAVGGKCGKLMLDGDVDFGTDKNPERSYRITDGLSVDFVLADGRANFQICVAV